MPIERVESLKRLRNLLIRYMAITDEWKSASLDEAIGIVSPKAAFVIMLRRRHKNKTYTRADIQKELKTIMGRNKTRMKAKEKEDFDAAANILYALFKNIEEHRQHLMLFYGDTGASEATRKREINKFTHRYFHRTWEHEVTEMLRHIVYKHSESPKLAMAEDRVHGHYSLRENKIYAPRNLYLYAAVADAFLRIIFNTFREYSVGAYNRTMFPLDFPHVKDFGKGVFRIRVLLQNHQVGHAYIRANMHLLSKTSLDFNAIEMEITDDWERMGVQYEEIIDISKAEDTASKGRA